MVSTRLKTFKEGFTGIQRALGTYRIASGIVSEVFLDIPMLFSGFHGIMRLYDLWRGSQLTFLLYESLKSTFSRAFAH